MNKITSALAIIFICFATLNLQAQTHSHGHSEELEIKEHLFVKVRPASEASAKYKWLEDYFLDNYEKYVSQVQVILKNKPNYSDNDFHIAVDAIFPNIVKDFERNATVYNSEKEKQTKGNNDGFKPKGAGDPCTNAGFETGDFTGWELFAGKKINAPYGYNSMVAVAAGTQHKVFSSGNDPNVAALPKVKPGGGTYSALLGDYATGSKAASMKQTFLVDANSTSYTYSYALVMEDPGHSLGEQPFFKVNMYDASGNNINCAAYSVIAGPSGDPGFLPYGGSVFSAPKGYYLPWRTTFIPLDDYVGQNVTIEFVTGDCSQSGHFGYAYIDTDCSALNVEKSSDFICNGDAVTLTAPPGAAGYLWSPGGQTTQSITTTTPGSYSVTITPVTGSACSAVIPIQVDGSLDHPVADFTVAPTAICIGGSVTITDASYVQGSSSIDKWEWDLNGDGTIDTTATSPGETTYNTAGTYNVKLTITNNGCTDTKTIAINVNQGPDATWTPPPPMCVDAAPVNLNSLVTGTAGGTWSGTGVTGAFFYPSAGTQTITYTVQDATCLRDESHEITVIPLPDVVFNIPSEICLKGAPITLAATPANGVFTYNGQQVTTFDPQANGLGEFTITYAVGDPSYPQCMTTVANTIKVIDGFPISADIPNYFCYGSDDYTIAITPTGGTFSGALNNDNILTVSTASAGNYSLGYTYTSPEGCTGTFSHNFTVGPNLKAEFTMEQFCGQNITLTPKPIVGNFVSYVWYDTDSTVLGTDQTFSGYIPQFGDHTFFMLATDNKGCVTHFQMSDSIHEAIAPQMLDMPNVITANGDGINDFITMPIMDNECIEYEVYILNRWGNVVYKGTKSNPTFDGKDISGKALLDGVYFYKIVSKDFDCESAEYKPKCYGFITIITK